MVDQVRLSFPTLHDGLLDMQQPALSLTSPTHLNIEEAILATMRNAGIPFDVETHRLTLSVNGHPLSASELRNMRERTYLNHSLHEPWVIHVTSLPLKMTPITSLPLGNDTKQQKTKKKVATTTPPPKPVPQKKKVEVVEEEEELGVLRVAGHGSVTVTPDRVRVGFLLMEEAPDADTVNRKLAERSGKLIALLREETEGKAEKLATPHMEVTPLYEKRKDEKKQPRYLDDDEERKVVAYRGVFTVTFESLVEDSGLIIDTAIQSTQKRTPTQVVMVGTVNYIVSESVRKPAMTSALRLATLDAEDKAEQVLQTLGAIKVRTASASIDDAGHRRPFDMEEESYSVHSNKRKMAATARIPTQLIAGDREVEASVQLTIEYRQ